MSEQGWAKLKKKCFVYKGQVKKTLFVSLSPQKNKLSFVFF